MLDDVVKQAELQARSSRSRRAEQEAMDVKVVRCLLKVCSFS